ncbi:MAG: NAD(P)-binding protein [Thermodesulfobacteriota bacterium]
MEEKIVIKNFRDVPILSISLQSTLWNKTGTWRYLRPYYTSKQAPCSLACPLGQDIPYYLTALSDGKLNEAWPKILTANPFPAVCGRVCHHPCEQDCNRKDYDEPLAIHALERFWGDWGIKNKTEAERSETKKEKIAVIGAGPAGLSCAYFLARAGYEVKVFEAMAEPGGMLRYGIPEYRLPRKILFQEIKRIEKLGVEIKTGAKFGTHFGWEDLKSFAAIFLATGAHIDQRLKIPGSDLKGIYTGLEFLKEVHSQKPPVLGKNVIVVGGGNTAVDSARVALRLGRRVTLVYRRTKEEMPAIKDEVEEALKEGVKFIFQAAPVRIIGQEGQTKALEFQKTRPGKVTGKGRGVPEIIKGTNFTMAADSIILAIGEKADFSFLPAEIKTEDNLILTDAWGKTNIPGVFAGGDVATGAGYVSAAIASGKRAATAISQYLRKEVDHWKAPLLEKVSIEKINLDYFLTAARIKVPVTPVKARQRSFAEVYKGVSVGQARKEAARCFSCGNCIQCNVCLMVCPDVAISFVQDKNEYLIDYDHCKGCGICAIECPRAAMGLEEEKWNW